jgi:hypothetical protein
VLHVIREDGQAVHLAQLRVAGFGREEGVEAIEAGFLAGKVGAAFVTTHGMP